MSTFDTSVLAYAFILYFLFTVLLSLLFIFIYKKSRIALIKQKTQKIVTENLLIIQKYQLGSFFRMLFLFCFASGIFLLKAFLIAPYLSSISLKEQHNTLFVYYIIGVLFILFFSIYYQVHSLKKEKVIVLSS